MIFWYAFLASSWFTSDLPRRLKSFNKKGQPPVYTVAQINTYPLGINAVQIVTTLCYAWWSDAVGLRWPPIVFAGVGSFFRRIFCVNDVRLDMEHDCM